MESLIGNRESEVRNQLLVHMYENATFDMDTTEQTWRRAKTARVVNAKRWIQTDTWRKILYGTKRLKHAMLLDSRAECECDILQCGWDDCAVNTVHSQQGARKAVPAIASTHPRAREGGAKAISEMERLESKFDRSDQAFKTQVKPPWKLKLHTARTTK